MPDLQDASGARPLRRVHGDVRLDGVTVAYDGFPPVLHNAHLYLRAGEHVGVIGSSGSGKSTLVALLSRLMDPRSGVLQSAPGAALTVHGHREEADVLRRWTTDAAAWDGADRTAAAEQLATRLLALPEPTRVPAHRDLHDKQLVAVGDRVGLLDLDTLCAADPALDLANLLAHLRLRVLQGHCTAVIAGRC
ncbi:MAG: ATP-binding cassette domain-containing protein, partial [Actinomycetota bacterium]|nr:ATP-binding cassette domain-containing protein [Actinomycetota bacterium]